MSTLRLLTRADDAGLNLTTNRAIRAAVKQGIVKNVSLLATAPAIKDAAEVLDDLSDRVDFGLHVCFTSEWRHPRFRPVSKNSIGFLRDDGSFPVTVDELAGFTADADLVKEEILAQLERLQSLGFPIRYLDEHMAAGTVNNIGPVLADVASETGLVCDRVLHDSGALVNLPGWNGPGPHPGTELADHLSNTQPGTYLILGHPGFKADEMKLLHHESGTDRDELQERNRQRRMFADIEIVDYCENAGVELLRYSDLA